jgi:lipoprotein signal peptidase
MIRNFIICIIFVMTVGCTAVGELAVNAIGGALGNMIDRRIDDTSENEKEKKDECEDCKNDKR